MAPRFLTPGLLLGAGKMKRPKLGTKGVETRVLFYFLLGELEQAVPELVAAGSTLSGVATLLLDSCATLAEWYSVLKDLPWPLSGPQVQAITQLAVAHNNLYRQAGCRHAPKHHGLFEMSRRAATLGNPRCIGTYSDETANAVLSGISRRTHPRTFAVSVFRRLRVLRWCLGLPI